MFNKKGDAMSNLISIGAVVSAALSIIAIVTKVWGPVKKMLDLQTVQSEAIKIILRQFLINKTDEIMTRKTITREEVYCLTELCKSYTALRGDNAIISRVNAVLDFPPEDTKFFNTKLK